MDTFSVRDSVWLIRLWGLEGIVLGFGYRDKFIYDVQGLATRPLTLALV